LSDHTDPLPPGSGVDGQAKTLGLPHKAGGARWRTKDVHSRADLMTVQNSKLWEVDWTIAA
jgi:hypothetical protein